jgi:thiol-disulfide isomerase/thioredoxin
MSAEIVALVGAETLTLDDLNTAAAIDAVMAGMAAQPPTEAAQIVEQAVNTAVVLQQPDVDVDLERAFVALEAFLAAHDQEYGDLAVALASSGINQDRFNRYFAQLVAADAYLRQQQSVTGASADMLVRRWQQDTRISFGPAAATFLAVAGVAPQVGSPVAEAGQNVEPLAPTEPASGVPIDEAPIAVDDELRGNEIGQIAPEFDLAELNRTFGEDAVNVHLRNFSDAPVVLIFWTTWCPYCLRQTPVLVEAHRQWAEQGIQFVGINVKEDAGVVEPYVAQHGITYPILLDEQGATAAVYAVQGYPTTFFLDSDHRIVARHVGALTEEQLNTYLVTLRSVE